VATRRNDHPEYKDQPLALSRSATHRRSGESIGRPRSDVGQMGEESRESAGYIRQGTGRPERAELDARQEIVTLRLERDSQKSCRLVREETAVK